MATIALMPVRVDRLRFIVLVDNSIEWMTQYPTGFKHEVPHHLAHDPPVDSITGAPIVDLENYCCGAHGLSILIETTIKDKTYRTLFDTGPDSQSLVRNLHALKIDAGAIEHVVLSHWHADHSGGLLSFLKYRHDTSVDITPGGAQILPPPVTVDVHPDRPFARGISAPQRPAVVIARLPADPDFDALAAAGADVEKHAEAHVIAGGSVYVSGEIPRVTPFEQGLIGAKRWAGEEGRGWVDEPHIMDERYLAVDVRGHGLVIFTACSHAGAVNVVRDAITRLGRPVHMLVGGLHLAGPEFAERIPLTTRFLAHSVRPPPSFVLPMHCSGFNAKVALREALGEAVVPVGTGDSYEIQGTSAGDKSQRMRVEIVE